MFIDSPERLKNKKVTINPKNNDNKCLQYVLTVALNYKQMKSHPERTLKIKPNKLSITLKRLEKA